MSRLGNGSRVHHPRLGPGVVRGVLDGGRTLLIAFDARPRAPFLFPAKELTPLGGEPERPPPRPSRPPPVAPRAPPPPSSPIDRQSLEALRLGVVPVRGLDRLTVGREQEVADLQTLLERGQGMRVLSGGYGTGKTHLLELAESHALRMNYLVGRATFDPVECPPSHPLRLYRAVVEGLRYPGESAQGLRPILERLAHDEAFVSPSGAFFHRWLSPVAWAWAHLDEPTLVDAFVDWVEGRTDEDAAALSALLERRGWRGPRLLALPDYRTFGQIMANLLGGIATWARAAGFRGLVVLLDEAEYLDGLGPTGREMAERVLSYLALATLPTTQILFHAESVYRGGHAVHRRVEPRFREDQPLSVVCAFTPHPLVDAALRRIARDIRVSLDPVPSRLFPLLSERVLAMVQEIHPGVDPPPQHRHLVRTALQQAFEAGEIETTRQAARLCVEYWDLYRIDPDRAARAVRLA